MSEEKRLETIFKEIYTIPADKSVNDLKTKSKYDEYNGLKINIVIYLF